jgi:two-component system, sensor histidine kinase and response regulator
MNNPENLRILIVDDNPNNLYSLNELIKQNFPVNIVEANSGYEALRIINEHPIDLCLMDVQMPEMDGFETARLIRSRPKTNHIPIIFITAFDPNKTLMDKGLHAGGLDYLTKPIDDVQIVHLLHMYFRFLERERNINCELEEKVQNRTSEFQHANRKLKLEIEERKKVEKALLESEQKLQEAITSKNTFFSIIAHDLRNPFNAVIGFSTFLKENLPDLDRKEIDEYAGYIKESANSAFNLLNNLLDWARSQTNMITYKPEKFNVSEILEHTLSVLSGEALKKDISVSSDIPYEVCTIADKNMISAVFRNLISNAIKFTPNGGKVFISSNTENGVHEFTIEDTGVGIKPEDIEKLFRIDTKISTPGTAKETGTGLGLILCREFLEKNGGEIRVTSAVGKGSQFRFSLPEIKN